LPALAVIRAVNAFLALVAFPVPAIPGSAATLMAASPGIAIHDNIFLRRLPCSWRLFLFSQLTVSLHMM
jgi:hypothetical protein